MELDKRTILNKHRIGGVIFILLIIIFKLIFNFYNPLISISYKNLIPQFFQNKIKLFQEKIIFNLNFLLPEPHLSIVKSLLFGGKNNLPLSLKQLIRKNGLSHIIAISGLHLAIIFQMCLSVLNFLPLMRIIKFLILILIILSYIVMADFSASILRAALMNLIMIFALLNYRQYFSLRSLLITILILALINPLIILKDIGFQLSALATMGIIYFYPLFFSYKQKDNELLKRSLFNKIIVIISNYFKMYLAAMLLTLPLILYYFHEFPLVAPLTNILIVPVTPLIIILSWIVIFLSLIFHPLALMISLFLKLVIDYFLIVIKIFGNLKFSSIFISQISLILVISYYLFLLIFLLFYQKKITPPFYEK